MSTFFCDLLTNRPFQDFVKRYTELWDESTGQKARDFYDLCLRLNRADEKTGTSESFSEAVTSFLQKASRRIEKELIATGMRDKADTILHELNRNNSIDSLSQLARILWPVFFPEGIPVLDEASREAEMRRLRKKRRIRIEKNPVKRQQIKDPARRILFTSNILLTVPLNLQDDRSDPNLDKLQLKLSQETQKFWYDHPIPLGIAPESNEILYGLKGLNEMMAIEKSIQNVASQDRLTCLLSVSTTHDGLHEAARPWILQEVKKRGGFEHLDVYVFTESDTRRICKEILQPLAAHFFPNEKLPDMQSVFGVDGEYGRHYSFLKAVTAFWQVFVDDQIEATFKIDLDQVFPQKELMAETGKSALQLLVDKNWGAEGKDYHGRPVHLGMVAGALVDHEDISAGLFSPDIGYPAETVSSLEEALFHSRLPQALSTEAEMMFHDVSGNDVLQRIHVTGGTNGILIESLFKYRPFTPSFLGRAEDQAYLLSVLFGKKPFLRYLHVPGLIMRHDKTAFAQEAMNLAQVGKWIGDYLRTILFSYYVKILPQPDQQIKEEIDPFSGCFVTPLPFTTVYLRWLFRVLDLFSWGECTKADRIINEGSERLDSLMTNLENDPDMLERQYQTERESWHLFYDILILSQKGLNSADPVVKEIAQKAKGLIQKCRLY